MRLFDRFKSYIDTRLGSLQLKFLWNQKFLPDAKKFRRETEASKLKYTGNEKQYLFNSEIEDYNLYTLELMKKEKQLKPYTF
jgi:hypothetical protein